MTTYAERPAVNEAAEYFFTYINQVPDGDVREILQTQLKEIGTLLNEVSEEQSLRRYASDKWTIKEVVNHISDTERVFAFRMFWFGRNLPDPLSNFDHTIAASGAASNEQTLTQHLDEFRAVRGATLALLSGLTTEAWMRRGIASGNSFTVRALAYITAGHAAHHLRLLKERYL
jgi:hypothetical protein